jgi:hypothetical protein
MHLDFAVPVNYGIQLEIISLIVSILVNIQIILIL